jgi:hypothetical protein
MLGLKGALAGLALAALAGLLLVGLGAVGGVTDAGMAAGALLGGIALSPVQWATVAALVPVVAAMTTLTAHLTMRRALARLV